MCEEQKEIIATANFTKLIDKLMPRLDQSEQILLEDEIDRICFDPDLGLPKMGSLSEVLTYKIEIDKNNFILSYIWDKLKNQIILVDISLR